MKPTTKTQHENSDEIYKQVAAKETVRHGKTARNWHNSVHNLNNIIYAFSDEIVSQYASTNAELTKLLAENDAIVSNVEESTTLQYTTEQGNF